MPDLLLELFSEEIPARMQRKAAGDFKKLVTDALVDAGLTYEGAKEYWTPRRLTLDLRGLTARSADLKEERKGPRTDAPEKAIAGFLRGAGLASVDDAEKRTDPKKGEFYVAVIEKPGRTAEEIIADVMPGIIQNFPWPKSMRWGAKSAEAGSMKWVRPLQSILCMFGPETEAPEIVKFEAGGVASGDVTYGHRFHAPEPITVRRFDDYVSALEKAKVVLDAERRKEIIKSDAKNLAFAQGLELIEDDGLLEEVGNLVEWPVAIMGEYEEAFLDIPPEVIRLTIKENQKCFVLRKGENLTNKFLLVANIEASDGGEEIAKGNAKVVNARLGDAKFFWETDLQQVTTEGFEPWLAKLDHVTFHAKLGSLGARVKLIMALAKELAPIVGADVNKAERAAQLAKADLNSLMVYEFPELQGLMGRRYAERAGEDADLAQAIEEHYKPQGPSDDVPSNAVSVAVALAEKIDVLVDFWLIGEKPTGSKDPFALRRAALGVIRLVVQNNIRMQLLEPIIVHQSRMGRLEYLEGEIDSVQKSIHSFEEQLSDPNYKGSLLTGNRQNRTENLEELRTMEAKLVSLRSEFLEQLDRTPGDLLSFFHDRLKVFLKDRGIRHDVIDAVISAESDDLLLIVQKATALQKLISSDDGENLLQGTKRAANILAAEEKKGTAIAADVQAKLFDCDEERQLFAALGVAETKAQEAVGNEDFESAMAALADLRAPIDAFFEAVHVNAEDEAVRGNRLALLTRIRTATSAVADFSKISG